MPDGIVSLCDDRRIKSISSNIIKIVVESGDATCKRYNTHLILGVFFLFAVDVVKMKGQDCFSELLNPALVFRGVAMIGDAHQ